MLVEGVNVDPWYDHKYQPQPSNCLDRPPLASSSPSAISQRVEARASAKLGNRCGRMKGPAIGRYSLTGRQSNANGGEKREWEQGSDGGGGDVRGQDGRLRACLARADAHARGRGLGVPSHIFWDLRSPAATRGMRVLTVERSSS